MPPAALSFLSQEKRQGRKECWDAFGACCGYNSGEDLNFSPCEHTKAPYVRCGTRRLLWCSKFVGSCVLLSAVNQLCVRNLQGSTDLSKISVKIVHSAGPMWASAPAIGASKIRRNNAERGAFRCDCLRQQRFCVGKRDGIQQIKLAEAVSACECGLAYTCLLYTSPSPRD